MMPDTGTTLTRVQVAATPLICTVLGGAMVIAAARNVTVTVVDEPPPAIEVPQDPTPPDDPTSPTPPDDPTLRVELFGPEVVGVVGTPIRVSWRLEHGIVSLIEAKEDAAGARTIRMQFSSEAARDYYSQFNLQLYRADGVDLGAPLELLSFTKNEFSTSAYWSVRTANAWNSIAGIGACCDRLFFEFVPR